MSEARKDTKKGLVPRLRFPGFKGEWEVLNGDEIFDSISNKDHNSDLPILAITQEHGAIPRDEIEYNVSVTDKSIESYKVVENGDFIISLRSFQGGIEYSTYRGLCSPAYIVLRKKIDIDNHFFKYFFKTKIFIQNMNKNLEGIRDGKMVSYKQFSELLLPKPYIQEQSRIADCLTSLDDLITLEIQKLNLLKSHKKGLMQQLFPAEGERVPRLRFPGFEGEWEEKTLGDTAIFFNGRAYKQEELLEQGKYRVLRVGNFFTNNNWYYSDLELEEDKYCNKGDLLYAWSASFGPRIWRGEKVIYHYHIWKVTENDGVDKNFLFVLLDYETERMKASSANGLGLLHITKGTIEGWETHLPDIKEQQRIADCIFSLDELIAAQAEKVDTLKAHKIGLMQGLFPAVDGVDR